MLGIVTLLTRLSSFLVVSSLVTLAIFKSTFSITLLFVSLLVFVLLAVLLVTLSQFKKK